MQDIAMEAPSAGQGTRGQSLNNQQQQQQENSITRAGDQEPTLIYTEEEAKAIWRTSLCECIEAYHATIRDLLPQAVRDDLAAWHGADFCYFKSGYTDEFPALPSFQIQRGGAK